MSVRPMRPEDRRFIVPTWVHSAAERLPAGGARRAFYRWYWADVDAKMDADEVRGVVLAGGDDGSALHAWAVGTDSALHYAYVPPELRGHGVARRLVTALLGAYPDSISTTYPWPRVGSRCHYSKPRRAA